MIQTFPNLYAPWLGSISLSLLTFLGALWLARFVKTDIERQGLALGVIVSLLDMIIEGIVAFGPVAMTATALVIAAGWLGGRLATRA